MSTAVNGVANGTPGGADSTPPIPAPAPPEWHPIPGYPGYEFARPDRLRSLRRRGRPGAVEIEGYLSNGSRCFALWSGAGSARKLTLRKLTGLVFGPDAMPPLPRCGGRRKGVLTAPRCPHCQQRLPMAMRGGGGGGP